MVFPSPRPNRTSPSALKKLLELFEGGAHHELTAWLDDTKDNLEQQGHIERHSEFGPGIRRASHEWPMS